MAQCDRRGKEASYNASDVLRFELDEPPETFTPHPLFGDGGIDSVVTERSPANSEQ